MAKKEIKPTRRYSSGDECLIALLSEPVKKSKIKKSNIKKIKQSEELLRYIIISELLSNTPVFLPSTS